MKVCVSSLFSLIELGFADLGVISEDAQFVRESLSWTFLSVNNDFSSGYCVLDGVVLEKQFVELFLRKGELRGDAYWRPLVFLVHIFHTYIFCVCVCILLRRWGGRLLIPGDWGMHDCE